MLEKFTVEEINLICIFAKRATEGESLRENTISELTEAAPHFTEPELKDITKNVLKKLEKISDSEFEAYEFYPENEDMEV